MALTLTEAFKTALAANSIEPVFVLKFEGIDLYFSAIKISAIPRYDDEGLFYDDPDLDYDKPYPLRKSKDYVMATQSTSSITQQIEPDKAGGTSATAMTFKIVDYQEEMSKIVSPTFTLDEFLGINCNVYYTVKDGTSFPEDSITVVYGIVEECSGGAGFVRVTIAHPQNLLRQDFVVPTSSKLVENFEYRSLTVQNNRYLAREPLSNPIYITYVYGAGITVVVTNNPTNYIITVTINNGVNTAAEVKKAIEDTQDATRLVEVSGYGSSSLIQTNFSSTLLGDSTFILVEDSSGFIAPNAETSFTSYVKIDDEILKIISIDNSLNKITLDTAIQNRGLFDSNFGVTGKVGDNVKSFYVLEGNAIQIALKLMLSLAEDTKSTTNLWGSIPIIGTVTNSVYFTFNVAKDLGIVVGDLCTVTGVFSNRVITEIVVLDNDCYIVVNGADIGTGSLTKDVFFKSKYNVLPVGSAIKPMFVDIEQLESINSRYSSDIPNYRFYVEDSLDLKEFLEAELFFPASLYMVPRKGRISCTITRPSTGEGSLFILDSSVIVEPSGIEIARSLNRYFYNAIKWYYNPDSINSDDYLDKNITINSDSVQRFKRGVVPLLIESKGLRPDLGAEALIERNTRRLIDRYKNAPEYLTVKTTLAKGIPIEIGDAVLFGDELTQITDTTQGNRSFKTRVFEVINKTQNLTNVVFSLLQTNYGINARYGIFSPSSLLSSFATTSVLKLKRSFATTDTEKEVDKWTNYVNQKIIVHNSDWTFSEEVLITSITTDRTGLNITPSLSSVAVDLIIEPAPYSDDNSNFWTKWKAVHCFFDPQVLVLAGISTTQFTVNVLDQTKFLKNGVVRIHNFNYSVDSGFTEYSIDDVTGNTITLKKPLSFVPTVGLFIDLIGFKDGGKPYSWV